MSDLFRQLNALFTRRERWQLAALAVVLVVRAAVELVGVASIMPFMAVVADPTVIETNPLLRWAYATLGFTSITSFVTALGIAVVIFLVLANGASALAVYGTTQFSWRLHHRLAMRLIRGYLSQPYSFFLHRNSASFGKTLLNECQEVIRGVLEPILNVGAKVLVIGAVVALLVTLDPVLAAVVVVVVGGSYGVLYTAIKAKQRRLGQVRVSANNERFKVINEAFGGIKDVKVLQREATFVDRFRPASEQYSQAMASNSVVSKIPRYFFDMVAFGGIVLVVVFYLRRGEGIAQILPVVSLYAFAGYRLMPEIQQLFQAAAQVRFGHAALEDLSADLSLFAESGNETPCGGDIPFSSAIRVCDVTFAYPHASRPALRGVTLRIERNQTVGLVGPSGSGKTTLVDLLLGLFSPDDGVVSIDGRRLSSENVSGWKEQVGYVPQHIFLTDDSIAGNVAFGVPSEKIDLGRVEEAARIAHLHEFIETLPEGYDTTVGERGVRLSGGQRQRIGIARALYHDPAVLILDEATSALDGATENAVMEAIRVLSGKKTIILIAHRLSTVEAADVIWMLQDGRVEDSGSYGELASRNELFRVMANIG